MDFERISTYLEDHKQEMVEDIASLIKIESVRSASLPGKPYGEGPTLALQAAGEMAARYGFLVKNYDHYVITADFSQQEPCLDILAHLDVVPGGNGWSVTTPFSPIVRDGLLYGRGAADDKGPAVAALYAMRALRDLKIPLSKNVRLILGSDEECGSSDLKYYYSREKEAPMSFSPDATFPVVNVEKGRFTPEFGISWQEAALPIRILSLQAGEKTNVVPDRAKAILKGLTPGEIETAVRSAAQETGVDFTVAADGDAVILTVLGQSAHASTPEKGNNVATALLHLLCRLPLSPGDASAAIHSLHQLFPHRSFDGAPLGIAMSDPESGRLTISLNLLNMENNRLYCQCDSRVPLCANRENTVEVFRQKLLDRSLALYQDDLLPAHQVPSDSPFVQTLLGCYEQVTGKTGQCLTMGGLTYVHELKNGVAFGCGQPGVDSNAHSANEFASIQLLCDSSKMFALAIQKICQ